MVCVERGASTDRRVKECRAEFGVQDGGMESCPIVMLVEIVQYVVVTFD